MSGLKIEIKTIQAAGEIKQIAWIKINNMESGNSYGPKEAIELQDFLDSPSGKKISGIVWTNDAGTPFCRGGNLKYYNELKSKLSGLKANREIRLSLKRLSTLPIPCIAVVRGDVFGGGLELLSCFDYVYSTPQALLGFWQRKVGLSFGWGGGYRYLRRMTPHRLTVLALEARSLSAFEARELRLLDEVIPSDTVGTKVHRKLTELLTQSNETYKQIKLWSVANEINIFEKLWWSAEHRSKTSRPARG